ncbi:hypothetical protein E4U42_001765 [Claviceps africana]|uniref:Peptidase A1 domain-containing protein n=1 Tax=Claviceps africana TaxID=83212 RepID=A0A8K0NJY6_9HYPO|nr:hypothetical protein E4U42_001765 [Claviceps africana]
MSVSKRALCLLLLAGLRVAHGDSSQPLFLRKLDENAARAVAETKGQTQDAAGYGKLNGDQGFLFAHFSVGGSQDLELLIDTGSWGLTLNPGKYKPGANPHKAGGFSVGSGTFDHNVVGSWPRFVILQASGVEYRDVVTYNGAVPPIAVRQQAVGSMTKPNKALYPHDGVIGFAGPYPNDPKTDATFISNLCKQGALMSCRFGIALRTDQTGQLYYGAIAVDILATDIVIVPTRGSWYISRLTSLTVNGKTIQADIDVSVDSGTSVIYGPLEKVNDLFNAAGVQVVRSASGITGYYDCRSPPKIGFALSGTTFEIAPEALALAKDGNNCTASVKGTNAFGPWWILGQPFFQGRYIDHDVTGHKIGFANLK